MTPTPKDALGNPIIFGNRYGYSNDSSGVTTVNSGIAKKETPTGLISIAVDYSRSSYGVRSDRRQPWNTKEGDIKNTSVKPIKLFPLESKPEKSC